MKKTFLKILCALIVVICVFATACDKGKDSSSSLLPSQSETVFEAAKSFSQTFGPRDAELRKCRVTSYGGTSSGVAVGYMDYSYSYAGYTVNVPETAYYAVSVRYKTDALTKYKMFVNELEEYDLHFQSSGSFIATAILVRLNKGENTLKIRNVQGQGYSAVIDTVSVSGLKAPSQVAAVLPDLVVKEGESSLALLDIEGFELSLSISSNTKVVALNGKVSYLGGGYTKLKKHSVYGDESYLLDKAYRASIAAQFSPSEHTTINAGVAYTFDHYYKLYNKDGDYQGKMKLDSGAGVFVNGTAYF